MYALRNQKFIDLFNCDIYLITTFWNQTHNIFKVCLYSSSRVEFKYDLCLKIINVGVDLINWLGNLGEKSLVQNAHIRTECSGLASTLISVGHWALFSFLLLFTGSGAVLGFGTHGKGRGR